MIKHRISESKPKINIIAINGDTTENKVPFRAGKEEIVEKKFEATHETEKLLPKKSKITKTEKNHVE